MIQFNLSYLKIHVFSRWLLSFLSNVIVILLNDLLPLDGLLFMILRIICLYPMIRVISVTMLILYASFLICIQWNHFTSRMINRAKWNHLGYILQFCYSAMPQITSTYNCKSTFFLLLNVNLNIECHLTDINKRAVYKFNS